MKPKMFFTPNIWIIVLFFCISYSCKNRAEFSPPASTDGYWIQTAVGSLSHLIIDDIFTPPVASRVYVYCNLAAYEAIRGWDTSFPSLTSRLHGFDTIPSASSDVDFTLAAMQAFFEVAHVMVYNKDSVNHYRNSIIKSLERAGLPANVVQQSKSYGSAVAAVILRRAGADRFKQTRGMPRYTIREDSLYWRNTPPDYLDAIEPHWKLIKPMVLDSAAQFKPPPPPPVNFAEGERFQQELMEVYNVTSNLTDEQKEIARFWDDNPATIEHSGHMMFANKKQNPVAHWMNIGIVCTRQAKLDILQSAFIFAAAGIALFDAFISCWDEKYRSEYVRPITAINSRIDEKWQPLLQTPPFPEYTSGHSVVSSAVTTVLTAMLGENFAFTDDYELPYIGIQRSFPSFEAAAKEACISRLYGGIHFRSAIENGRQQGLDVGYHIVEKLDLKTNKPASR